MERLFPRGRRLLALALLVAASGVRAADAPPPTPPDEARLATGTDGSDRMTVPVVVNGSGPFRFVIDTGADRTVVSDRLAAALTLPPRGAVTLWSSTSREVIGTAELASLELAGRRRTPFDAAVIPEETLQASGVLGVDSLADRRVVLDFRHNELAVARAPEGPRRAADKALDRDPPGTIVVTAKRRLGQLILTDARYRGHRIDVVVDTGAEISIGNDAFLALVTARQGLLPVDEVVGVTGRRATVRLALLNELQIGPLTMHGAPLAFADLACFERFGLTRRPALLLGMNVLRQFARVAIDFRRHQVAFLIASEPAAPPRGPPDRISPL